MPRRSVDACLACGRSGHLATRHYDAYQCPVSTGPWGDVVEPDEVGRCGHCGGSGFTYQNGMHTSRSGVRGYRCMQCGCIKREDWRKLKRKRRPHGTQTNDG